MKHVITKLTNEEKESLVSDFLKSIGERLRDKRVLKSLSQADLADCLSIDQSTLSKYENGDRDMQISLLPLFSVYCKFPLYDLFPKDESQFILDVFSKAVTITVARKKRQEAKQYVTKHTDKKVLKGQVYEVDGEEVFEPVIKKSKSKTLRMQYKDAERHTEYSPYTDVEFCDFIKSRSPETISSIINAGALLEQLDNMPHKDTLKGAVADYIIDELIIEQISHKSDVATRKAYAYYSRLYWMNMNNPKI